ncbi:MAG: DUF6773 family protein [Bacilli bacterium]
MKRSNLLDEMQEKKRLQIESRGLWVAYFGIVLVILVQYMLGDKTLLRNIAGELVVLFAVACYLVPNYIKHGIWSTKWKPTLKTNLIISSITGLLVAVSKGVVSYVRYGKLAGSMATAAFVFLSTGALIMLVLTICAQIYKRRVQKLENPTEDNAPKD